MSEADEQQKATPRLRFPEFRDKPAWRFKPLKAVGERVKQRNSDEGIDRVLTNSAEHGVLDQRDFFDKDIATAGKLDNYFVVESGDYVYNPRISRTAPVGPISRNNIGRGVMSPLYTVFRLGESGTDFHEHYFATNGWHDYLRSVSSTGARHDRMSIGIADFMRMPIPLPDPAEQRKIAACLGSLDAWIAAESRALAALRRHKTGLMQQLFPRPGQTRPRLRFPEFQNAGEWAETPLEKLIEVASGQVDPTVPPYCDMPHVSGEHIVSNGGGLTELQTAKELGQTSGKYLFGPQDLLYSKIRPALNKVALPNIDGTCSADIYPIRPASGEVGRPYLFYLLLSDGFLQYAVKNSARSKIPKLNRETLLSFETSLPQPAEQRRIADCLAALDARLSAQTKKLAALRYHKRGLMQQLFPHPDARPGGGG